MGKYIVRRWTYRPDLPQIFIFKLENLQVLFPDAPDPDELFQVWDMTDNHSQSMIGMGDDIPPAHFDYWDATQRATPETAAVYIEIKSKSSPTLVTPDGDLRSDLQWHLVQHGTQEVLVSSVKQFDDIDEAHKGAKDYIMRRPTELVFVAPTWAAELAASNAHTNAIAESVTEAA